MAQPDPDSPAERPADRPADRTALVAAIHATPTVLVLAVTGGGVAAVTDLLGVPGASRTVLEVLVPYAETSLRELTGPGPEDAGAGAVSQGTAEAMATACLARARHLAPGVPDDEVIGVACTAALVTDRPRRGAHRGHLAVARRPDRSEGVALTHQLVELEKGLLDRVGEDRAVADAVLAMIATACGAVDTASGADDAASGL
ncbi:MAG: CinA family protein [Acidimicrobiales bacterium]